MLDINPVATLLSLGTYTEYSLRVTRYGVHVRICTVPRLARYTRKSHASYSVASNGAKSRSSQNATQWRQPVPYELYVSGERADVTILPTVGPCANLPNCPATRVAASGAHASP